MIRPLRGAPIAVIDFETTGPIPTTCRPVSVAVVFIDSLGITAPRLVYSTLINPGIPIPPDSTAIHGITDADVLDAPNPQVVFEELIDTIGTRVVAAYNLSFDWIVWWLCRLALPPRRHPDPPPIKGICAFVMARAIDKYESGKKLAQVAERRDTSIDAHKAESDAMATALMLPILLGQLVHGVEREKWGSMRLEGPWCQPSDVASVEAFEWWIRRAGAEQEAELREYFETKGKTLDSTPWLDLREAYQAPRAWGPENTTPTPAIHEPLPSGWIVPWQAQETA